MAHYYGLTELFSLCVQLPCSSPGNVQFLRARFRITSSKWHEIASLSRCCAVLDFFKSLCESVKLHETETKEKPYFAIRLDILYVCSSVEKYVKG